MQGSADLLLDILELIERIERQVAGLSRDQFLEDTDVQERNRLPHPGDRRGGEGARRRHRQRNPEIPWRQILGLRNILAHGYFIRESELIWETIQMGLPALAAVCRTELDCAD
ncbi:MAG TPA: HepT-like ribonuclease domain-containing protein [Stellaceae bacterium]|jgi:uncharacterized protein with HEPN domain